MEDKILEILKENQQTMKPVKVKIGENEAKIQILAFDRIDALGKKGGVLSFYFEE